jgi:hypothetical protein
MIGRTKAMRTGGALLALALAATSAAWGVLPRSSSPDGSLVEWDAGAAAELEREFHQLHHLWNEGDLQGVKDRMIGDDVLVTFELQANARPVALRSKAELDAFMDGVVNEEASEEGSYELEMPEMKCRATSTVGICTEECKIHFRRADGTVRTDYLFGTAVAVRHQDGWKWIQYHMSVGAPSEEAPATPTTAAAPRAPAGEDPGLRAAVRQVEEWKTPGLEAELSGLLPHPTDANLYYVLSNAQPPYRPGQTPRLAPEHRGKLLTVDKRTGEIVRSVALVDDDYGGMAYGEGYLWIATTNGAEILKVDPVTFSIVRRFPLSSPAGGLEYDPDRRVLIAQLYVGHPHLAMIDMRTGAVTRTLWSDESAMGLVKVDGDWLCTWATGWDPGSLSELRVIDQETGHIRARMPVDGVHTVLAPGGDPERRTFLTLVTVDSRSGETVIRKFSYDGEHRRQAARG